MSSPLTVTVYYSPSTLTLDLMFHVNISWVDGPKFSLHSIENDEANYEASFNTNYLNKTYKVKVAHEALKYHYKDSKSESDFLKAVAEQITKVLRGIILDGDFVPKKVQDLILETAKSLLVVDLAKWLNKYACGWTAFKAAGIPNMEGYNYNQEDTWKFYAFGGLTVDQQLSQLANLLPGVNEFVKYPCSCPLYTGRKDALKSVIIHLNDSCGWSREDIADWIETLDVDTTFKTEPVEVGSRPLDLTDGPFSDEDMLNYTAHQQAVAWDKMIHDELKKMYNNIFNTTTPKPPPEPKNLLEQIIEAKKMILAQPLIDPDDLVGMQITISDVKFNSLKNKEWKQ